jgi:hypothetical protein
MGTTLAILFVVAQNAPGQVGFDIQDLHPIPPLPETMRSPMPSLPPPPVEDEGDGEHAGPGRIPTAPNVTAGFVTDVGTFVARVDPEGRVSFHDKGVFASYASLTIYGRFGGVSAPREKQAFLEDTFEERFAMRAEHGARVMEIAIEHLPRYLAAVWRYREWSLQTRKRILFELWDECAEQGNEELVEGGRAARRIITRFVRRYLPADGDQAFTEQELTALNNERTSAEPFAPYVLRSAAGGPDEDSHAATDRVAVRDSALGLR